jgi:prepilin-type N-terminal cleavage/methylation domain-containing protein
VVNRLKQNGFTIVELVLVIAILATLLSIATLSFNNMQRKASIERYTRELFSELNTARSDSIFRKNRHSIVINAAANGYAFRRYSSENENRTAGGTVIATKTMPLTLSKLDGSSAAGDIFQFDTRGFAAIILDTGTLRINPVGTDAVVDCIVVAASRTNLGKMEGANCVQK